MHFFKNYKRDGTLTVHMREGCSPRCASGQDTAPATEDEFAWPRADGARVMWGHQENAGELRGEKTYRRWTCRQCWWRYRDRKGLNLTIDIGPTN